MEDGDLSVSNDLTALSSPTHDPAAQVASAAQGAQGASAAQGAQVAQGASVELVERPMSAWDVF
jgi:hypothetical protein